MRKAEKNIILTFTVLIAILSALLAIDFYISGFRTSLTPGWHTTISPSLSLIFLALIILITSLFTYLTLTGISKLWLALRKKLSS